MALATPLLVFPRGPLPWLGLGLLLLGWALRGLGTGAWRLRTPLDRPLAVLLLMLPVALYASADLSLSLPKLYGLLLGPAVFAATVAQVTSRRDLARGAWLLIAASVGITLLGLVGTDWNVGKLPLEWAYRLLPRLVRGVQASVGSVAGFHPNELGGTLGFLLPLPLALLLGAPSTRVGRVVFLAALGLGGAGLVLTASRSALGGLGVAVLALLVWRWRRLGLGLVVASALGLGGALALYGQQLADFALSVDALSVASGQGSLPGRLELWGRAAYMLADYPFTGIGLNTFPVVLQTLYPPFLSDPATPIPHAHSIYLQAALDLGLAGLLGYAGLWAGAAGSGWRASRALAARDDAEGRQARATVVGLLAGLLSFLVYGLTDAIALGAKPAVLLWLMLGLVVAAERLSRRSLGEPGVAAAGAATAGSGHASLSTAWRVVTGVAPTVAGAYWLLAYALVGLGYLVVLLIALGAPGPG